MEEFGDPRVLRIRRVDDPVPGSGQVLVAVEFASITFVETQVRAGGGPAFPRRPALPRVPGNGVGGRIVATGPDVDPALVGTVVVTTTGGEGGYAELALAGAGDIVPVPEGLGLGDAVALLADGRTAVGLHARAEVKPGEWVLVEAAGGGVGSLLVQLAAGAGARVIGAAGGPEKEGLIKSLGASAYVDYSRPGWARQVVEATGGTGVDLVFDGVGGDIGTEALTALREGGRVSVHGMASGSWSRIGGGTGGTGGADRIGGAGGADRTGGTGGADRIGGAGETGARSITVVAGKVAPTPAELRALTVEALALAVAGRLRPTIGQTFPLAEAAAAHRAIENRQTVGKTLLVP
ncbi:zinc-binding dehydrogenase [Streptosporangium sp. G11]|uniref:zinc-binding dehydrogenase n=1 Tax=Streptosporangium sp. G11 TaxID=3436926 RepID=UPI003EBE6A2A